MLILTRAVAKDGEVGVKYCRNGSICNDKRCPVVVVVFFVSAVVSVVYLDLILA